MIQIQKAKLRSNPTLEAATQAFAECLAARNKHISHLSDVIRNQREKLRELAAEVARLKKQD